jgi:uncharacterized repeat protein (TIGR03803 family)
MPTSVVKTINALLLVLVLALACVAQAQTFSVLLTFNGANGAGPDGGVLLDDAGNIYGTTVLGGTGRCPEGCGVVYMLNSAVRQVGVVSFDGSDGSVPRAGLLRDASGNLFGTTANGGDMSCYPPYGCGTVFKMSRAGKETVLHRFNGTPDGAGPVAVLVEDEEGNLYGTTEVGGLKGGGTVFKIDAVGHETILHNFAGPSGGGDGEYPHAGVIRDAEGNLYGTTYGGGALSEGTVYQINASGIETVLHSFTGGPDGGRPASALLIDSSGNLYGTTQYGGNGECYGNGCGVLFELSPQLDGTWDEAVLYVFCSQPGCSDGAAPVTGPLVRDAAGTLYGATFSGGDDRDCGGCGVVYRLDSAGQETVLYTFTGGSDGSGPWAGLALDASGNLYGTAVDGGKRCADSPACGVVFKIIP